MTSESVISNPITSSVRPKAALTIEEIIKRGDPVVREQKRQLYAGIGILIIVLALLYPFADWMAGSYSPYLLLLCGLILPIINNLISRHYIARPFTGDSVLANYLAERRNIKAFTILTALLRGFSAGMLIGCMFFSYKIDEARGWVIRGILLLYVGDLVYIIRLWIIRFGRLLANLDYFHSLLYPDDQS